MSAAAEAADMTAADATTEAAADTARVAATTEATTTASRLCLRSKQARRQQCCCQNGYRLFHHVSPFAYGTVRATPKPRNTESSDEPKIGTVRGIPTKFAFRNFGAAPGTELAWVRETPRKSTSKIVVLTSNLVADGPARHMSREYGLV